MATLQMGSTGAVSPPMISPFHFTTKDLSKADQFEAWRDFMSSAIAMDLRGPTNQGFEAEQTVWDLGSFALTRAELPSDGPIRTWQHLRKDPLDHWCLVLVTGPSAPSGVPTTTPGELYFRSLAQSFEGAAMDSKVLTLFVPRDLFGEQASRLDQVPVEVPAAGIGSLLADYFVSLHQRLPSILVAELPNLVEVTRTMIAACLAPTADRLVAAQDSINATLLERARKTIRQNLRSPMFGPDQLCRALGVSRSRLYRLFENSGGVARYIHRQRLRAAHVALTDADTSGRILQVAEGFGFSDASGFSRAFKQEFGYSPTHARAGAAFGRPARQPLATNGVGTSDLGDLLRRLHA
jgi:AraC-like DNA-binding protein